MAEDKTKRIRELIRTLRAAGRAYYQESREIMSNFEILDEDSVNESLCKKLSEQEVSKAPDNRASPINLLIDFIVVAFKI